MSVEIGIGLPSSLPQGTIMPLREIVALAELAESVGFSSVWIADSLARPYPKYEALTVMAAVAARTARVKLGTKVLVLPYRHPVALARVLMSIDRLSEGRLILGAGVGWNEKEFQTLNEPFRQRGRRTNEMIQVMRRLWTEPEVTFRGEFYQLEGIIMEPKPVQKPGPPIWIGGMSQAAARRVASLGDGWLSGSTSLGPDGFRSRWLEIVELARQEGRDPAAIYPATVLDINVSPNRDQAMAEARRWHAGHLQLIKHGKPFSVDHAAYGTPQDCLERIRQYVAAGARTIVLEPHTFDYARLIELVGKELLPCLR